MAAALFAVLAINAADSGLPPPPPSPDMNSDSQNASHNFTGNQQNDNLDGGMSFTAKILISLGIILALAVIIYIIIRIIYYK